MRGFHKIYNFIQLKQQELPLPSFPVVFGNQPVKTGTANASLVTFSKVTPDRIRHHPGGAPA